MKPYWRDEAHGLEIYHGDCLEVMPQFEREFEVVFTDPPYGIEYNGGTGNKKKREPLAGDARDVYGEFLPLLPVGRDAAAYIWFTDKKVRVVYAAAEDNGWTVRALIIWNKMQAHYGAFMAQYMQKHEPCLYLVRGTPPWYGPTNEVTVWDVKQPTRSDHPTQKPIALAVRAVQNSSAEGDAVLDPFLGSGTTLVACYRLGRRGVGIEISEEYCELSAKRLEREIAQGRLFEPAEIGKLKQEVLL